MKLCKNQSKRKGRTYCRTYHDYPKDGKCSIRCNRRIPTFWWKIKTLITRKLGKKSGRHFITTVI